MPASLSVACPSCLAEPGALCDEGGSAIAVPHLARRHAAARARDEAALARGCGACYAEPGDQCVVDLASTGRRSGERYHGARYAAVDPRLARACPNTFCAAPAGAPCLPRDYPTADTVCAERTIVKPLVAAEYAERSYGDFV